MSNAQNERVSGLYEAAHISQLMHRPLCPESSSAEWSCRAPSSIMGLLFFTFTRCHDKLSSANIEILPASGGGSGPAELEQPFKSVSADPARLASTRSPSHRGFLQPAVVDWDHHSYLHTHHHPQPRHHHHQSRCHHHCDQGSHHHHHFHQHQQHFPSPPSPSPPASTL